MILIPRYRDVWNNKPIVMPSVGVEGRFKMEAIRPDGRRRLLCDWQKNLITNTGMDNIGNTNNWIKYCFVGTNNTTPTVSDTSLGTQVASTLTVQSNTVGVNGTSPYYGYYQRVFRFAQGDAAGNLTEVGVGPSGSTLTTHSLILDGSQNPTTITVLSDEILDVTYEFRMYAPASDWTGTVVLDSETFDVTARARNVLAVGWLNTTYFPNSTMTTPSSASAGTDTITAVTTAPAWISTPSFSDHTYTNGTYYLEWDWFCDINNSNYDIKNMQISLNRGQYQFGFASQVDSGGIPKDNTKELTLTGRLTWSRH